MRYLSDFPLAGLTRRMERLDVIYLYLDLESKDCQHITASCENMGFFFCGVRPFGLNGRHALMLQYLNNLEMDFDKILIFDPFAKRMLEYIKLCIP